jgi:hypothetical protein
MNKNNNLVKTNSILWYGIFLSIFLTVIFVSCDKKSKNPAEPAIFNGDNDKIDTLYFIPNK